MKLTELMERLQALHEAYGDGEVTIDLGVDLVPCTLDYGFDAGYVISATGENLVTRLARIMNNITVTEEPILDRDPWLMSGPLTGWINEPAVWDGTSAKSPSEVDAEIIALGGVKDPGAPFDPHRAAHEVIDALDAAERAARDNHPSTRKGGPIRG